MQLIRQWFEVISWLSLRTSPYLTPVSTVLIKSAQMIDSMVEKTKSEPKTNRPRSIWLLPLGVATAIAGYYLVVWFGRDFMPDALPDATHKDRPDLCNPSSWVPPYEHPAVMAMASPGLELTISDARLPCCATRGPWNENQRPKIFCRCCDRRKLSMKVRWRVP